MKENKSCLVRIGAYYPISVPSASGLLRNQLIPGFRRQHMCSKGHSNRTQQTHTQTNCRINPRLAQFPTRKEPVFVVVQIRLIDHSIQSAYISLHIRQSINHTTRHTAPICTILPRTTNKLRTFHPYSRNRFVPVMMIRYDNTDMASSMTAKDIRKPTERHIEQKYRSEP